MIIENPMPKSPDSAFEQIVELFKSSVITQAIIVLVFAIGTFGLLFTDRPVPEWLVTVDITLVGFYFGAKLTSIQLQSQQAAVKQAQLEIERLTKTGEH